MLNYKKLSTFFGLLFLFIGLLIYLPLYLLGNQWNSQALSLIPPLAMWGPMLSALITEKIFDKKVQIINPILKLNKFLILSWFSPVIVILLALIIASLFPGTTLEYNPDAIPERMKPFLSEYEFLQSSYFYLHNPLTFWGILFNGLCSGIFMQTLLAFGEERGWRVFLLKELSPLGFWKGNFLLGFIWGLWHFPLVLVGYNFPNHPYLGLLLMGISCALLSPLMAYLTLKTKHVFSAALFHGSLNGVFGISIVFIKGGNDLLVGPFAIAGILALIILNLFLYTLKPTFKTYD